MGFFCLYYIEASNPGTFVLFSRAAITKVPQTQQFKQEKLIYNSLESGKPKTLVRAHFFLRYPQMAKKERNHLSYDTSYKGTNPIYEDATFMN